MGRSTVQIIAEILDTARGGAGRAYLMYSRNLSFKQINSYLNILTNPSTDINKVFGRRRRDKFTIITEILEIAKERLVKTHIMNRADLNSTQLNDYLRFMLKKNLLQKTPQDDKEMYQATAEGINLLSGYSRLQEILMMPGPLLDCICEDPKKYRTSNKGDEYVTACKELEVLWIASDPSDRKSPMGLYPK